MSRYCCEMRRKFVISIVMENLDVPTPTDLCDFVIDWDRDKPLIAIKHCPFCGAEIDRDQELRDPNVPE